VIFTNIRSSEAGSAAFVTKPKASLLMEKHQITLAGHFFLTLKNKQHGAAYDRKDTKISQL
jgi:hypothetical protein